MSQNSASSEPAAPRPPAIHVAPGPHLSDGKLTTRRMMIDVLIALIPVVGAAVFFFGWYAVKQVGLCTLACLVFEAILTKLRGRPVPLSDFSAAVTGVILGLSLPWSAPWYIAVIGSGMAIALGKVVFGGLGFNVFNPAMVGRAFVMLSFARDLGAGAYVASGEKALTGLITQATPLTVAKKVATDLLAGKAIAPELARELDAAGNLWPLCIGNVNGSLGETSAIACVIGGLYLILRRTASWEIPAGVIGAVLVCGVLGQWAGLTPLTAFHHLVGGAVLFGAFFIATDPVSSPLTFRGKLVFGAGIGVLVMVLRLFSGYPEGLMFAVLLMNAVTPLLNRWTVPRPVGGPVPQNV